MAMKLATNTQLMIDTIKNNEAVKLIVAKNPNERKDVVTNEELLAFQQATQGKTGLDQNTQDAVDFTNKELAVDPATGTTKFAATDQYGADHLGGKVDSTISTNEIDKFNIFNLMKKLGGIKLRNGG